MLKHLFWQQYDVFVPEERIAKNLVQAEIFCCLEPQKFVSAFEIAKYRLYLNGTSAELSCNSVRVWFACEWMKSNFIL